MQLRPPPPGFTDLAPHVPGLKLSVGYATPDNFCHQVLPGYGAAGAWLLDAPAEALRRAAASLRSHGLGLTCYDAYRPRRATLFMVEWLLANGLGHWLEEGYVSRTSRHNRGISVDVGLYRLDTGAPLDHGTAWDSFGPDSHFDAAVPAAAHAARATLRAALVAVGFEPYRREWWHFEFPTARGPARDVPYGDAEPEEPPVD